MISTTVVSLFARFSTALDRITSPVIKSSTAIAVILLIVIVIIIFSILQIILSFSTGLVQLIPRTTPFNGKKDDL